MNGTIIAVGLLLFILVTCRLLIAWTFNLALDILDLMYRLSEAEDEDEDAIEFEPDFEDDDD